MVVSGEETDEWRRMLQLHQDWARLGAEMPIISGFLRPFQMPATEHASW